MLIKQTDDMTERERIAVQNSNNQFLQALSYVAVGTIFSYAGKTAPETFMFCDGRALDITEYAELFEVIGYTFGGSGDIFNLPNLCGKTLVGLNDSNTKFDSVGKTGGKEEVTLTSSEMPEHAHKTYALNQNTNGAKIYGNYFDAPYAIDFVKSAINAATVGWSNEIAVGGAGGGLAHENMPPYVVCNYIIKVANGISKEDFRLPIDQVYNPESENAQSGKALTEALSIYQPSRIKRIKFELDEDTSEGQLIITIGNCTENAVNAELSFFNPRLLYNGVDIINPMTEDYFNESSTINYRGYWNLRGKAEAITRKDGYKLVDSSAVKNSWSCVRYFLNDTVLKAGTYEFSIEYWGAIEQLPNMDVTFEGKKLSVEKTGVQYYKFRDEDVNFKLKKGHIYTFTVKDEDSTSAYIVNGNGKTVTGIAGKTLSGMKNGFIICADRCSGGGLTGTLSLINLNAFVTDRWDWSDESRELIPPYYLRITDKTGIDIWDL